MDSLTTNNVSRRAVLMGGAALGAAGAAGLVTRGLPAAAQAAPPAIPRSRVGATFDLFPFKKGTTWDQAVDDWNSRTGTTMRCWKVYYGQDKNGHGVFPASISAQIHTIIKRDIQALISVKPTVDTTSAQARTDRAKLRDALIMFKSHKLIAEVCLWQEVSSRYMTGALARMPGQVGQLFEERGVAVLGSGGSSAYRHGEARESAARSRPRLTASAERRRHVRPGSQDP